MHTPGPWICNDKNELSSTGIDPFHIFINAANGDNVAIVEKKEEEQDQQDWPNALLLAAAPDLLKWATEYTSNAKPGESAADYATRMDNAFNELRAAITKATGAA